MPRPAEPDPCAPPLSTARQRFAWALFDFANSAFPTVIVTAVYVVYFKKVVVGVADPGRSDNLWGMANSAAAAVVFLLAPLLGAAADAGGKKRAFLAGFTLLCVAATALLGLTGPGTVALAMVLLVLAVVGFEASCVFYNAFLPDLVPAERMGRLSGQGWALGYVGGLGSLLVVLPLTERHLAATPLVVAAWFLVFAVPAWIALRDKARPQAAAGARSLFSGGAARLKTTLCEIGAHRRLTRFLVAFFFFDNAVLTIIVFAVAFSTDSLGFTTRDSVLLMIAMNAIAAPGALLFGRLADRIGSKRTLMATLAIWLAVVAGAELAAWPGLFTPAAARAVFWGVAGLASLCIGATQATSRAFVGQLAPSGRAGEFYGFMAFAGKGSAVAGPLVFGLVSDLFDSQRAAVATIGLFFAVGFVLLARVPDTR